MDSILNFLRFWKIAAKKTGIFPFFRVAYNNWRPKFYYNEDTEELDASTIEAFYLKPYIGQGSDLYRNWTLTGHCLVSQREGVSKKIFFYEIELANAQNLFKTGKNNDQKEGPVHFFFIYLYNYKYISHLNFFCKLRVRYNVNSYENDFNSNEVFSFSSTH